MQVGTKERPFRSKQGMVSSTQAEYRLIPAADQKLMRTRWISFHEQNWVHSCERRGSTFGRSPSMPKLAAESF